MSDCVRCEKRNTGDHLHDVHGLHTDRWLPSQRQYVHEFLHDFDDLTEENE